MRFPRATYLVAVISGHWSKEWLRRGVAKRLEEELNKIGVEINKEKTKTVDATKGESFNFLGFTYKRIKTRNGKYGAIITPNNKARKKLMDKVKEVFESNRSTPIKKIVEEINPIIRGWVNYFRIGNSSRCFSYIKDWVEKKVRRHMMKVRGKKGFGWKRWSKEFIYKNLELYNTYEVSRNYLKALPVQ